MARNYAAIQVSLWTTDTEFQKLHHTTQWLYLYLVSQGKLDAAGVIVWRPTLVQKAAADLDQATITTALEELQGKLYAIHDPDTGELLIRSFIRNDGRIRNSKQAASVTMAWESIDSEKLRGIVSHEVARIAAEHPDMPGLEACKPILQAPLIDPSEGASVAL